MRNTKLLLGNDAIERAWYLLFIELVLEQNRVSHTYFPRGDPGLSNPREEDSLEALSKCQIQFLTG